MNALRAVVKVRKRGTVVLPAKIREALQIAEGDLVIISVRKLRIPAEVVDDE